LIQIQWNGGEFCQFLEGENYSQQPVNGFILSVIRDFAVSKEFFSDTWR